MISDFDQSSSIRLVVPEAAPDLWLDPEQVTSLLDQIQPDMVINTLGWSDDGSLAEHSTVLAPLEILSELCRARDLVFCQLSNYRIFSGVKSGFVETDEPSPRDQCGAIYLAAEQLVAQIPKHMILRLSWVVGCEGSNLLTKILQPLLDQGCAEVIGERRGAPVGAGPRRRAPGAQCSLRRPGKMLWTRLADTLRRCTRTKMRYSS